MSSNTYVLTFDTANIRLFAHTVGFFRILFDAYLSFIDRNQEYSMSIPMRVVVPYLYMPLMRQLSTMVFFYKKRRNIFN